jgi:hypothetical protein
VEWRSQGEVLVKAKSAQNVEESFAAVVTTLGKQAGVTMGGKGFGSSGLKYRGKLFAMISSKQQFVAKLSRERVDELVRLGQGERFDPGHGRLMKEWIAMAGHETTWIDLAREAYQHVRRQETSRRA